MFYNNSPNNLTPTFLYLSFLLIISSPLQSCFSNIPDFYFDLFNTHQTHHEWWSKCQPLRFNPPFIVKTQTLHCQTPKSNQTKKQLQQRKQKEQDQKKQQQIGWWRCFTIVAEQIWYVVVQSLIQVIDLMVSQKQISVVVKYDDNFASINGGTIILKKSSNRIHAAQSILDQSSDRYLYTDEKLPIQILIALKEEVSVDRISIKSGQIYSSIVKDFILEGAFAIQSGSEEEDGHWFKLLDARAKNNGQQQQFWVANKVIRFLKLRIISKYGDWKYFTMTQIKVYGKGLYAQAMTDYKKVKNNSINSSNSSDTQQSKHGLQNLDEMIRMARSNQTQKPDQNMLTFLIQKVNNLSRIEEHQIFYMNNLTKQLDKLAFQKQNSQIKIDSLKEELREKHTLNQLPNLQTTVNQQITNIIKSNKHIQAQIRILAQQLKLLTHQQIELKTLLQSTKKEKYVIIICAVIIFGIILFKYLSK